MAEPELYLFTGPEAGEKNDAIAYLKEEARKKNGNIDEFSYYAGDVRIADVISQLQNESLFSSAVFVVLRNAHLVKLKADIELVASWAKSAGQSANTLVLATDEIKVEDKLKACVPSSHQKIFWEMFDNRKPQWVRDYFRKNGFSVADDAVDLILEMIENNTEQLKMECSRFFFCFEKGHVITVEDVESILSHNREETPATLFEAMADASSSPAERLESAMGILQKMQGSKNSSVAVETIGGLAYCFRTLRTWFNMHANGANPSKNDLRAAGISAGRIPMYQNASRVWSAGEASSILALLSYTDMRCREDGRQMEDVHLFRMIYSIIIKKGIYCASYEK